MVARCVQRLVFVVLLLAGAVHVKSATNRFGFTGPEIFPVENFISNLRVADLNGDGLNDIVVANNIHSRISILYNRTGKTNAEPSRANVAREINDLPADARFRIASLASEKRISSLQVEDLNGDGRPDLAYYGEPRELILLYKEAGETWSAPKRWLIEDGELTPNALVSGDLTGDGRPDLVLLAEEHLYLLKQNADHTLSEPIKLPISRSAKSMQIIDANHDRRSDLLLVNWDDRQPFRLKMQQSDGQLGPEIFFASTPIRAYWADQMEPEGGAQLISIAQNSGRAQIYEFLRKEAEPLVGALKKAQFQVLPLSRSERARRGLLWADLNGDSLQDLIVAEPESGQITLSFQQTNGVLAPGRTFPSLAGVTQLAAEDWNGDGQTELFLLSPDERQIGVARLDDKQRLPFPELLPVSGRPLVMAVGRTKKDAAPALAVVTDQDSRRVLELHRATGQTVVQKLSERYRGTPSALSWHDADQDGLTDLVILTPYERIKVLRQLGTGEFEELDVAPPGGFIEQPWLAAADMDADDRPELLLSQRNFVRATVLRRTPPGHPGADTNLWSFEVKEQINGAESNSRLTGAAALHTKGAATLMFLLDSERKALTLCERDASGVWRVVRNLPLPVAEFTGLQILTLGREQDRAVALVGMNAVGMLALQGPVWELSELDGYETPIKEGRLNDLISGDLDNDGRKELIFLETGRNYLDVVTFTPEHKLVPGDRWQVFEERTFRARTSGLPEPREAVVADVTGDKKNDLIVLVHDRLLVYPQE